MTYHVNVFKLLFSMYDHVFRIRKAERITNLWGTCVALVFASMVIYGWMAYLGIGTNIVSSDAAVLQASQFEFEKFWFIIGRILFSIIFACAVLFIPPLVFLLFTDIPYQKLVIMQQIVLLVLLVERVIWIPIAVYGGLDWFVSPFSFGIIISYITQLHWVIAFFGAISIFQIWVIWFQTSYTASLSHLKKNQTIIVVLGLHIIYWAIAAALSFFDTYMIGGWFG